MYHSITIGDRNTWSDWHLIPASRPLVNPPPVKTNMIEIPGADGVLDLTENLSGRPVYGNRTGSWTFYVDNGHAEWSDVYSTIMAYLHGKALSAVLEDDPSFYYEGRFSVNQWLSEASNSKIVINYDVGPYKLYSLNKGDRWLWDTFNFENGVIKSFENMIVRKSKSLTIAVEGDSRETIPTINVTLKGASYVRLTFNGAFYKLKKGINILDEVVIGEGMNTLLFQIPNDASTGETSDPRAELSIKIIGGRL